MGARKPEDIFGLGYADTRIEHVLLFWQAGKVAQPEEQAGGHPVGCVKNTVYGEVKNGGY